MLLELRIPFGLILLAILQVLQGSANWNGLGTFSIFLGQDLVGAFCITDIHEALSLSEIGDERKMFLIGTHVAEDGAEIPSSMKDTRELIAQLVSESV